MLSCELVACIDSYNALLHCLHLSGRWTAVVAYLCICVMMLTQCNMATRWRQFPDDRPHRRHRLRQVCNTSCAHTWCNNKLEMSAFLSENVRLLVRALCDLYWSMIALPGHHILSMMIERVQLRHVLARDCVYRHVQKFNWTCSPKSRTAAIASGSYLLLKWFWTRQIKFL